MANTVGVLTLIRREFKRTRMTIYQVIFPPIIVTLLFIYIFGLALGSQIKTIAGVPYLQYLLPGLVMLYVIASSYDEAASSLFHQRFMQSIQELLIAPLSDGELLAGYLAGSILRGVLIGNLVMLIGWLVVHAAPHDISAYAYFIIMTSLLFSSVGIIAALLGKTFDNLAVVTTFVITPLTYVGGVFSSMHLLPPLLQRVSLFNPMLYMVDGLRYSYIGIVDVNLTVDGIMVAVLAVAALAIAYAMIRRGVNLRV